MISPPPSDAAVALLIEATIWGLSQETAMGEAVAKGLLSLTSQVPDDRLRTYVALVRRAADTGPTLGRIWAIFLAPVMMLDDAFLDRFQNTVEIMLRKGTYTLTAPLEAMADLISSGDGACASAYLDLLAATFNQEISYNQSLRLVYLLPKAVRGFASQRRRGQIAQLHRVVSTDLKLVDPFLDGMDKGLGLLDEAALEDFVGRGLKRYAQTPASGAKFLSLSSKVGQDICAGLQRAVPLGQVSTQLNRYLQARIGRAVSVRPLSELPQVTSGIPWVCSDGAHIYLPDEIDLFADQEQNVRLFKALARLEAGHFECQTYDFDLEKARDNFAEVARWVHRQVLIDDGEAFCDGERFIHSFSPGALAADLFDLYEQARVAAHLAQRYPGLMQQVMPVIRSRWQAIDQPDPTHPLVPVYAELVLHQAMPASHDTQLGALQQRLCTLFHQGNEPGCPVENSARMVCLAFDLMAAVMKRKINRYVPMIFPFERRLHWDLIGRAFAAQAQTARRIKVRLKEKGLSVYRSDLQNRLDEQRGALSAEDIAELVLTRTSGKPVGTPAIDMSELALESLLAQSGAEFMVATKSDDGAYCYPEWAHNLQDYLRDHTRVHEIEVTGDQGDAFYRRTLMRHHGLVTRMRRAFELLKPEGLTLLRQWPEGDAFDYRALLDFVMDRRAGRIPSDRLFIKRLKQVRDVAVMLLVDLSRSTANVVPEGHTTVLEVAKEALVLFCEALQVVGDRFAVAGFSGTGRQAVDFYGIKHFQEPLTAAVQARISALQPQRSTRMGAAIRHACALMQQADARVRIMIIVSDGFPNDLGYKADYAIADTRRAVQEARSKNFHVKAITVNIGSDPRLDELYGRVHHHVIGDVRELPDKLLRLYGTLTRF